MYFVCTDQGAGPIAHATLELAIPTLRSELTARVSPGFVVKLNDRLEFEVARTGNGHSAGSGQAYRLWVEDEDGQNVTSKDAAEAG